MKQADLFDLVEGRRLRNDGIDRVETHYPDYLDRARVAAKEHAVRYGRVDINDVRKIVGSPPPGVHHNIMGAVFHESCWRVIGMTQVRHPAGHARRVLVYELTQGRAA